MFCKKCGNQLDESAIFCNKCGTQVQQDGIQALAENPTTVYVVNQKPKIEREKYVLKQHEKVFIILIGILTIVNGTLSFISSLINPISKTVNILRSASESVNIIYSIITIVIVIIGIFVLLKHRWALIVLDLIYLISSISTGLLILTDFRIGNTLGGILEILLLGYLFTIMVFIHIVQNALKQKEQIKRVEKMI